MKSGVYYKQSARCRCWHEWLFLASVVTIIKYRKLFNASLAEYQLELAYHESEHANENVEALLG